MSARLALYRVDQQAWLEWDRWMHRYRCQYPVTEALRSVPGNNQGTINPIRHAVAQSI